MYSTIYVAMLLLCGVAFGQEELLLKPPGTSQLKPIGGSIMFTCETTAAADVNLTLKWFVKGTDQSDFTEITTERTTSRYVDTEIGGSVSKLYITSITDDFAGLYRCTGTIGEHELSKEIELLVYKPITFHNTPLHQNPKIHTDALINCTVTGGPPPEVSWTFGGRRIHIVPDGRQIIEPGQGLRILNITKEDDGLYTCRAEVSADGRYDERRINVTVYVPPQITAGPETVERKEGESLTISCAAEGVPQPTYIFTKDSSEEPLKSNDNITVDSNAGRVEFGQLSKSDEGRYKCLAINAVGNEEASGQLTVLVKPEIYILENVVGIEGESAELVCLSHGFPTPKLTFQKAGTDVAYQLGDNEDGRVVVSDVGGNGLKLTITDLQPTDSVHYSCKSVNSIGSHERTASLAVNYKPRFEGVPEGGPEILYAWAGKQRNLTCRVSGEPTPELHWFANGEKLESNTLYHIYDLGSTSYLQVSVREADQPAVYNTYTCRANNTLGSVDLPIELRRAVEPSGVSMVRSTKVRQTFIELEVDAPDENGGLPVVSYQVQHDSTTLEFGPNDKIIVTNLAPNTSYIFHVRALNEVGAGAPFEFKETTEPTRQPNPVVITSDVAGNSPYEYLVSWEMPDNGGLPIDKVMLKVRPIVNGSDMSSDWKSFEAPLDAEHPVLVYRLKELSEKTKYELQVFVHNAIDWSEPSEHFVFSTSEDRFPTVHTTTSTTVTTHQPVEKGRQAPIAAAHMSFPSIGTVTGIVIVVLLIMLAIIDVSCYFINGCGVTSTICGIVRGDKGSLSNKEKEMEQGEGEALKFLAAEDHENEVKGAKEEKGVTDNLKGKSDA